MEILIETDDFILTKEFTIFDKVERIFASIEYGTCIIVNKKRLPFKKTIKNLLKNLDVNPCEYIDKSDLKDEWKKELKDVWIFYHGIHYPLKDYLKYTTFNDNDKIDKFYVDKNGVFSVCQDKYLTLRKTAKGKNVIDVSYNGRYKTIRCDEIIEQLSKEL